MTSLGAYTIVIIIIIRNFSQKKNFKQKNSRSDPKKKLFFLNKIKNGKEKSSFKIPVTWYVHYKILYDAVAPYSIDVILQ